VASEMEFPELYPMDSGLVSNVQIRLGKVPEVIPHPGGYHGQMIDVTPNVYRLTVKDVATFFVADGVKITIDIHEGASLDMVRLFCLSNAFAALLHQQKKIPLHAAALLHDDHLLMIMGDSGVGKSTTLATLMKKGLKPFSDDVCVPVKENGLWQFYSSYPMMKFWKSTLEMEDIGLKADRKIRPDLEKYGLYFHNDFITSPRKPLILFVLSKSNQSEGVSIQRINGVELFQHLERNAYRAEYLQASDLRKEHFHFFAELSNQVPCYLLNRSQEGAPPDAVADLIWQELSKLQHG
jgi:hypothetical protein